MKKYLYVILFFILTLSFSTLTFAEKEPWGDLRIPVTEFSLDNFDQASQIEAVYYFPMSDSFFTLDKKMNVSGEVVEKWETSRDGKTWTFHVKKGIKFHNGDDLTAEDVMWSFDRFADSQNSNATRIRENKISTELKDKYTFVFKAKRAEPFLVHPISTIRIYPKKYYEKVGKAEFNKHPIGSGPWKYVSKIPGKQVIFEANTEHWQNVPHFKRLIFIYVPEESTRVAMFKRGDLDICYPITYDTAVKLKKEGFRLKSSFLPNTQTIQLSGTWETDNAIKDIRVRKAMSFALNRQEMCDTYFKGFAKPAAPGYAAGPSSWGWKNSWKADPYDPAKAKNLLKEAGYPEKFTDPVITIYSVPGISPVHVDTLLMCADYWRAIGLKVKIESLDSNAFFGYIMVRPNKKGDPSWPVVGKVWSFPMTAASFNGYIMLNISTSKGLHTTMNDAKADKMFEQMMTETNMNKARKLYQNLAEYTNSQYVQFNSVEEYIQTALGPKVGDFTNGWHMSYALTHFTYLTHGK